MLRGLVLCLSLTACASAAPDGAAPRRRPRLVRAFALYLADDQHDLGAGLDGGAVTLGHDAGGSYFESDSIEPLRTLARTLPVPAGDVVLFGVTATSARTYLVQSTPLLEDTAVASASATTRGGAAGVLLTFQPEAYDVVRGVGAKGRSVVVVDGEVEPAVLQPLDDGQEEIVQGPDGQLNAYVCSDHTAFLALTARNGATPEQRAQRLASSFPSTPVQRCTP